MSTDSLQSKELSRRLLVALITPVVMLLVIGSVLGLQILRMSDDARWVDHSDNVLSEVNSLQKEILDQETGLRGYLVTNDRLFLEPYNATRPFEKMTAIEHLVGDNPNQRARLDSIRRRYQDWLNESELMVRATDITPFRRLDSMTQRKMRMDELRALIGGMVEAERAIHVERVAASADSYAQTRTLFVALFVLAGVMLAILSRRQLGGIAQTYAEALESERIARVAKEDESWIRTAQMKISEAMQGDLAVEQLGNRALEALAPLARADIGAFFVADGTGFRRRAGYALDSRAAGPDTFARGEGLVSRAASKGELLHLRDVPGDFMKIRSGVGETLPIEIALAPATLDGTTHAVVELGFLAPPGKRTIELLGRIGESIAVAVRSAEYKQRLRELLEESQRQTEELTAQQEELRVTNEELDQQSRALRETQAEVEHRQEELEATNARLEEQASELLQTQAEVTTKAAEVERSSRYKSEFLANMSHELRTPLNSTLILAKLLADNREGNLTPEQVKFAQTIYGAGNDLLTLINDVLDLSKIEAGKVEVSPAPFALRTFSENLKRTFEPLAHEKKIAFEVRFGEGVPEVVETDGQRVDQIIKNLLSNALKFTEHGSVTLEIGADASSLDFAVHDTGIGIEAHQHGLIFDAFRQADGTSNRKYGGTGLGLSISRDLARLLGGAITVTSTPGKGSVFTLSIPREWQARGEPGTPPPPSIAKPAPVTPPKRASVPSTLADDRAHVDPQKRLVLVIEDDLAFAKILLDLAHELDFQCVLAHEAASGLAFAAELAPSAIILDMHLPDRPGLSVLDQLKRTPATRHIPVHCVSALDYTQTALSMGAVGYMLKPVKRDDLTSAFKKLEQRLTRRMRRLLIVEDDEVQRESLTQLLGGQDIEIVAVGTVKEALAVLRSGTFDCVVTDLTLPDASGFELIEKMANDDAYAFPPVIVYTGRSLTTDEEQRLRRHSSSIIVKGARSPERLLDEATLFLHRVESELPPDHQRMLKTARDREAIFEGRRILVVEDDVRNIFALSSVLEPLGAKVTIARNGREALDALEKTPDVGLVLMDIMMPEMDGITAMKEIRKRPRWAKLPIIALTAKAMKDDQERCLQAGANDYVSKPIDVEMLLSLLRVWMSR